MSIAIYRKKADGTTSSAANVAKYGVVEPNLLSAPRSGRVFASRPAVSTITELENGMFVDYTVDTAEGPCVKLGGKYMVFNEEKLYDERLQSHRDFVQKAEDSTDGVIVPRVFGMAAGDVFTTNTVTDGEYAVGDKLSVAAATGLLKVDAAGTFAQVIAETTLPDGVTPAVKVQIL